MPKAQHHPDKTSNTMSQPTAPSIPREPAPGKDPPEPSHVAMIDQDEDISPGTTRSNPLTDAKAMPPPSNPHPRRSSSNQDPPRSPNIILTEPTFTNPPSSQAQTPGLQTRSQQDMLGTGGALSSTAETVKERPPFAPFFTLVNDTTIGNTYHPAQVHYLFSDDEASDVLRDALIRSCSGNNILDAQPPAAATLGQSAEGETSSSSAAQSKKGKGKGVEKARVGDTKKMIQKEREERVVIVDVNESGDGIKAVYSANPTWAVLGAEIANAPTWDGAEAEDASAGSYAERGLMLKIEGVGVGEAADEVAASNKAKRDSECKVGESGSGLIGEDEMQNLLDGFDKKMAMLRRIVNSGEEYRKSRATPDEGGSPTTH